MKRSGGQLGRPLAHMSVEALERLARNAQHDYDELTMLRAELKHRKTRRARELKDLVDRLRRHLGSAQA